MSNHAIHKMFSDWQRPLRLKRLTAIYPFATWLLNNIPVHSYKVVLGFLILIAHCNHSWLKHWKHRAHVNSNGNLHVSLRSSSTIITVIAVCNGQSGPGTLNHCTYLAVLVMGGYMITSGMVSSTRELNCILARWFVNMQRRTCGLVNQTHPSGFRQPFMLVMSYSRGVTNINDRQTMP